LPYYTLAPLVPAGRAAGEVADAEARAEVGIDARIESFDAQRSAARAYVQGRIEAAAKVRIERHIPGHRYRNVRVACLIERQTTERIALPAWVLAYRYRGAPYRAIVHGQRREIVFGASPIDLAKVGWIVAMLAVVAAIAALIVLLR
jgi:hypothetical protein